MTFFKTALTIFLKVTKSYIINELKHFSIWLLRHLLQTIFIIRSFIMIMQFETTYFFLQIHSFTETLKNQGLKIRGVIFL